MSNSQSATSGCTGERNLGKGASRSWCRPHSTALRGHAALPSLVTVSQRWARRAHRAPHQVPPAPTARFSPLLVRDTLPKHLLCVPWRTQGEGETRAGSLEEEAKGQSPEGWEGPACSKGGLGGAGSTAAGRDSRVTGRMSGHIIVTTWTHSVHPQCAHMGGAGNATLWASQVGSQGAPWGLSTAQVTDSPPYPASPGLVLPRARHHCSPLTTVHH